MSRPAKIAIDGPVASGKTSVGMLLAQRLNYRFLDTGVMYRALAWLALHQGMDLEDEGSLGRLAEETPMGLREGDGGTVLVAGREASTHLREPRVDQSVSLVARIPRVRDAMVRQQQAIARKGDIVMVGRDIGTVVLPDADLKLYLQASVAERARRRHAEVLHADPHASYAQVLEDLEDRDALDTGRAHSPLRPAPDALVLHTDGLTVVGLVQKVLEIIGEGDAHTL